MEKRPSIRKTLKPYEQKNMPTSYATFQKGIENTDPGICANVMIGLIKVAVFLLGRQIDTLEQDFLKNGGLRERMTKVRKT